MARDTKQEKWRDIGEKAIKQMSQLAQYSSWNFENKLLLLQAEQSYLNGRYMIAELTYQSSITSASDHKFIGEEAMANELFGVYLIENKKAKKGIEQLQIAHSKYIQWGAFKKASAVKELIDGFKLFMVYDSALII